MWGAMIPALVSLASLFAGGSKDAPLDPLQQRLMNATLGTQARRMTMQNPLYEAVQRLAMRLMPTGVQQPIRGLSEINTFEGEPDLGRAIPRGQSTPRPTPGGQATPRPTPNGGGGTGGDGSAPGGGSVPGGGGRPQGPNPNLTFGPMGIDPGALAQLFGRY